MMPRESIIPVFVPHLGCPHQCVFCNQRRISGETDIATADTVRNAIEEAVAKTPQETKRQLAFYGGSFTAIPAELQCELLGAAKPYLENGSISAVRLSTRPDAIDSEVLDRLEHYGVGTVELGAQSLDDEVLKLAQRGHTAQDVEKASQLIKSRGFKLILQMMTGLPSDSDEKCVRTAQKIIALKPDGVRIYPTVIVMNTELCDMWREGSYREHSVEDAVRVCAVLTELFSSAGIPIIRMGLNPTDELSGGAALAGAYHPALGELVYSRLMLNRARKLILNAEPDSELILGVHPSEISKMTGQHRCNIEALKKEFGYKSVKIKAADINKGEITIF